MVERKKATIAEKLQQARIQAQQAEQKVAARKANMKDAHGNQVVTNVEVLPHFHANHLQLTRGSVIYVLQFRNYVNRLRAKTNDYKKKRAALQDLRAETGVLTRTTELLQQQQEELRSEIVR